MPDATEQQPYFATRGRGAAGQSTTGEGAARRPKHRERPPAQGGDRMKTNAIRLLEEMGIRHELRTYEVDPDDLTAQTGAAKVGLPPRAARDHAGLRAFGLAGTRPAALAGVAEARVVLVGVVRRVAAE